MLSDRDPLPGWRRAARRGRRARAHPVGGLRGPAENLVARGRRGVTRCCTAGEGEVRVDRDAACGHKPMLLLLRAERRAALAAGAEPTPTADVGR